MPSSYHPRSRAAKPTSPDDDAADAHVMSLIPPEPHVRYPTLSDDALLFEQLVGGHLHYVDPSTESTHFIRGLDHQRRLLADCIANSTSPPRGAWFRFIDGHLLTDLRHRRRKFLTVEINGGLTELDAAYRVLRRSARSHALEELLCREVGRPFTEDEPTEGAPISKFFWHPFCDLLDLPFEPVAPVLAGYTGNKMSLLDRLFSDILFRCSGTRRLVEPFGGTGSVGINLSCRFRNYSLEYDWAEGLSYLIADANPDLFNLYSILSDPEKAQVFHASASRFFETKAAEVHAFVRKGFSGQEALAKVYSPLRIKHNASIRGTIKHAVSLLWLQRHSYNHMLRYNSETDELNVPPRGLVREYPESDIRQWTEVVAKADITFAHAPFAETMNNAVNTDIVYCDPPYVTTPKGGSSTTYCGETWKAKQQQELVACALSCQERGIPVLISNNDYQFTRELYAEATELIFGIKAPDNMAKTKKVRDELIAVYLPAKK